MNTPKVHEDRGAAPGIGHGASKDRATITSDGAIVADLIEGVELRPVRNIITGNGITTEIYSAPWGFVDGEMRHCIQVTLSPRAISAWHLHERQTDHIYALDGTVEVVLYDDRERSSTRGAVNVFRLNRHRPEILKIPPFIWHGTRNLELNAVSFINYFNVPYQHESPDEWRLPWDSDRIPHRFPAGAGS